LADFKAYVKDEEIVYDGPDEKVEIFTQFLEEMEEATDALTCDCISNNRVRSVAAKFFPEYEDDIMALFESYGGYCDCYIGTNLMSKNSVIKKLGYFMDVQEI